MMKYINRFNKQKLFVRKLLSQFKRNTKLLKAKQWEFQEIISKLDGTKPDKK